MLLFEFKALSTLLFWPILGCWAASLPQKEMGETEAEVGRGTRRDLRHDRHTVSLLTDHLVFSPKYRGWVLLGEVAEAAEEIIRNNCKELDIEVIDKPFFKKESFTKETGISTA